MPACRNILKILPVLLLASAAGFAPERQLAFIESRLRGK